MNHDAVPESVDYEAMITLNQIQNAISDHNPLIVDADVPLKRASVALILNQSPTGLKALFVVRARKEEDPWSGHIAFPGGHVEADDESHRQTAERETREETHLDLSGAAYLGQLDDVTGTTLKIVVSGFVFHIDQIPELRLNYELRESYWITIETLLDRNRHHLHHYQFQGKDNFWPAIDILGPDKPALWGLTYRLVGQLLNLTGHELPGLD